MAKTNAEIQQEYNEALKVSQSLTGALTKMVNDTEASQKKLSDAAKAYNENLKNIYSSATDVESTEAAILAAEKQKGELSKRYFGANQKLLPQKRAEADVGIKTLKSELKRLQVVKQVDESQQKLTDSINGAFDGLLSGLSEIPVIGKAMSSLATGPVNYLKDSVSNAGKTFVTSFSDATKKGATGMQAFAKAGGTSMKSLAASLAGPQAIIAVVVAIAAAGVIAFYKVSKAAKAFREETGLLNSQTGDLESKFAKVASTTAEIGGSIEDVSKAASTFSNEFDGLEQASEGVLTSMVALNKNFGVSLSDTAKLNKMFTSMSDMSANTAQSLINTTVNAAKIAGVAPNKVIADMAASSEEAYNFFTGNPKALASAAVQAAKLGTSLKQAVSVSKGLLDFESSISKELEASAMLGTRINFNKARALAADKDALGAQQAVVDEVQKLGDLSKLSTFEMEALADASGMPIQDLERQIDIRQNLGKLQGDELAAANKLIEAGRSAGSISDAELAKSAEQIKNQREMQSEFDNMGNQLSAIGTELLMAFMPIGKMIMAILIPIAGYLKGLWAPVGRAISGVMDAFKPIQNIMKDIFGEGAGIAGIFEFIGTLVSGSLVFAINLFSNGLKMVTSIIGGIWDIFKGIFTGDFDLILDGLMSLGEGILRFFYAIPMVLFDTLMDMFPTIGGYIVDFFSSIGSMIAGFFTSMIPDWIKDWFMGDGELASDASELQSAGSINDGIVQDGKIISTNPEDTLIATKTPDDFLSNLMANSPMSMLGEGIGGAVSGIGDMIGSALGGGASDVDITKKLDELIIVMRGNKDVYMDGKKVTAGVSNTVDKIGSNSYAIV